jgi:hypothetical protein
VPAELLPLSVITARVITDQILYSQHLQLSVVVAVVVAVITEALVVLVVLVAAQVVMEDTPELFPVMGLLVKATAVVITAMMVVQH